MQTIDQKKRKDSSYMIACCLAGLLITVVQFTGWKIPAGQINQNFIYHLLSSIAILSFGVACYKMGRLRSERQDESLDSAIKFVPICSSCKQIRIGSEADKLADNWESIEDYLYKNSKIRFSHSICPDCADDYIKQLDSCFIEKEEASNS